MCRWKEIRLRKKERKKEKIASTDTKFRNRIFRSARELNLGFLLVGYDAASAQSRIPNFKTMYCYGRHFDASRRGRYVTSIEGDPITHRSNVTCLKIGILNGTAAKTSKLKATYLYAHK